MELSLTMIILLIILGMVIGIISTIAGVGGGVLYVPSLTLFFFFPIDQAINTSTFVILISSTSGFITYLKQKRTDVKLSLIFACFSILGSLLCTIIFSFVTLDNAVLRIIFATLLIFTGLNMIRKGILTRKKKRGVSQNLQEVTVFLLKEHDYKSNLKKGIPLFILGGFAANLLGIGGGVIYTPALNIILGYPIHNSTAISTSMIFFTAIYNVIVKSITGTIDYIIGVFLGIGSVFGAFLGARISNRMPRVILQFFVAIVLIVVAIRMYF
ncbi:MAG: sulfite exporter TauE/SafE family protein [Promethearchaeota archaeon]